MKLNKPDIQQRILRALHMIERPAGASQLLHVLRGWGVTLGERSIRLYLLELDAAGWTRMKSPRLGRVLTDKGLEELSKYDMIKRMAFISGQIDEMNYRMGFSLRTGKGTLVSNTTWIPEHEAEAALSIVRPIFAARLGMGTRILLLQSAVARDAHHPEPVPPGKAAMVTVCSVTLNGILLKEGIPVTSRFGGLMEFKNRSPVRFVELLEYGGTTQDPLELFIRAKMTSVRRCARTGNGLVGASFREFPSVALPEVVRIRELLRQSGLDGILAIGAPNQPLFGLPVREGRTGMVVLGGLNPVAALEESGMATLSRSLAGLVDFGRFSEYPYAKWPRAASSGLGPSK